MSYMATTMKQFVDKFKHDTETRKLREHYIPLISEDQKESTEPVVTKGCFYLYSASPVKRPRRRSWLNLKK